jgi:hypothetical protein
MKMTMMITTTIKRIKIQEVVLELEKAMFLVTIGEVAIPDMTIVAMMTTMTAMTTADPVVVVVAILVVKKRIGMTMMIMIVVMVDAEDGIEMTEVIVVTIAIVTAKIGVMLVQVVTMIEEDEEEIETMKMIIMTAIPPNLLVTKLEGMIKIDAVVEAMIVMLATTTVTIEAVVVEMEVLEEATMVEIAMQGILEMVAIETILTGETMGEMEEVVAMVAGDVTTKHLVEEILKIRIIDEADVTTTAMEVVNLIMTIGTQLLMLVEDLYQMGEIKTIALTTIPIIITLNPFKR